MRSKKLVSMALTLALVVSTLVGCGGNSDKQGTKDPESTPAANVGETKKDTGTTDSGTTEPVSREPLTLDVFDAAANYQGVSTGWFAKIVKDKFNLELNIIAPNISGDGEALYQTRCSAGNLGDIILLDNADYIDCIKAGLIADITNEIYTYPNLADYKTQIDAFNSQIEAGKVYGIPTEMTNTSPTSYSQNAILSQPSIPWDYYKELGCPEVKTLDDLLDVLEKMLKAHPANVDGDSTSGITMWADWDDTSIENANQLTKWFGEEVNQSILIDTKGNMRSLLDDNSAYYKALKFFFKANQKGLIDPDSGTQDWMSVFGKIKVKRPFLLWYNWQPNFYNLADKTSKGDGYTYIPIDELNFYQTSDSYYGSGRVWGVGSQLDAEKKARCLEFLDWYASPEGIIYEETGIKDFNYQVREDGTFVAIGDNIIADNIPVPDEYGGGSFPDGRQQLNQWIVANISINPANGEMYNRQGWSSEKEKEPSLLDKEWREHYSAQNALDLMRQQNKITIVPSVNLVLDSDTTDIALIRSQCKTHVCNYSWKMVFASDEAEFDSLWNEMKEKVTGLGYDQLVDFDKVKYQKVIDVRNK